MGKLGFFDSGIGGLTVMQAFRELYPDYDMEYFGDCANCPYGDRPHGEIIELVVRGVEGLVDAGCTIIVLACNTAVAHAVQYLQNERFPSSSGIKILGVTLPGAEKVAELGYRNVGVLATLATVHNRAYRDRVHVLDPNIRITEIAVPGLVNLIEAEKRDIAGIQALLEHAISQFEPNTEAMVLGCTHYPLVREEILAIWGLVHGTPLELIDPGMEAAKKFGSYLERHPEFELSRGGTTHTRLSQSAGPGQSPFA